MNTIALRAYSQADGQRPALPDRRKEAITDRRDVETFSLEVSNQNKNAGQLGVNANKPVPPSANSFYIRRFAAQEAPTNSTELFTRNGSLHEQKPMLGTIFDAKV